MPTQATWRALKTVYWYQVSLITQRQWPSRYKTRWGELEGLNANNIRYHCDIQEAGFFAELVRATVCHYAADLAHELIFVCDGAQWIWRLAKENFPQTLQILDWSHAVEYLTLIT